MAYEYVPAEEKKTLLSCFLAGGLTMVGGFTPLCCWTNNCFWQNGLANKRVLVMDRDLCVASSVLQARGFSRGWKIIAAGLCVFHLSRRLDGTRSVEVLSHFPRTVCICSAVVQRLLNLPPIVPKISSATCGKVFCCSDGGRGAVLMRFSTGPCFMLFVAGSHDLFFFCALVGLVEVHVYGLVADRCCCWYRVQTVS